jgi:DNA-binding PadR family transcriptional regulator
MENHGRILGRTLARGNMYPDMSKSHKTDKRARPDLEQFVLALVERGLVTPYDLQASAGLSPGATIPVLTRLEESGFVRKGKPGPRGRTEYEVTNQGRTLLKNGWKTMIQAEPPTDIDGVLRVATLAFLSGAAKREVGDYLARASEMKRSEAKRKKLDSARLPDHDLELYGWMRSVCGSTKFAAESNSLKTLATKFKRLKFQ